MSSHAACGSWQPTGTWCGLCKAFGVEFHRVPAAIAAGQVASGIGQPLPTPADSVCKAAVPSALSQHGTVPPAAAACAARWQHCHLVLTDSGCLHIPADFALAGLPGCHGSNGLVLCFTCVWRPASLAARAAKRCLEAFVIIRQGSSSWMYQQRLKLCSN